MTTTPDPKAGPRPEDGPTSVANDPATRDVLHHDAITTDPTEVVQLGPNETPPGVVDEDDTTKDWPGPVPPNANDGDRPVNEDDDEDDEAEDEAVSNDPATSWHPTDDDDEKDDDEDTKPKP